MPDNQPHIAVRNLSLAFGDFVVQRNLDFTIARGEVFVIMGGSGCGKSTLLKAMIGLMRPATGDDVYSGQPFWSASDEARGLL